MIGSRGGYGYTTSDEVNRGPSWNTDRDYNTRSGYGTTGDRDVYYKQETRTYGGDNWTPSRPTTGDYPYSRYSEYPTTTSRWSDYPTTRPTTGGDFYPTSRNTEWTGRNEYPITGRYGFSGERTTPSRGYPYGGEWTGRDSCPTTGGRYGYGYNSSTYDRDYPTTGRYGYSGESRGYPTGYSGDRDYTRSSYSTRY
jgi:hypothetical protein